MHVHALIKQVLENYEESGPTTSYTNKDVVSLAIIKIYNKFTEMLI